MIIRKRINVGTYAKKKQDFNDGDILTFNDAGKEVEGRFGVQNVFKVQLKGGEFAMNINNTSLEYLSDDYGPDTKDWVGKSAKIHFIKMNVSGKITDVAYLTAPGKSLEDYEDNDQDEVYDQSTPDGEEVIEA